MAKRIVPTSPPPRNGPIDPKLLAQFIRSKRTNLGLTIHEAALLCNVSLSTISKIETASGSVMFDKVLEVCDKLGIKLYVQIGDDV
ncbi:helix-turn-helix transcriptional regulator [Sulfuricurvum sp.]|uniref:helix-turn-helix domain-containing protein n=1 Tax=Sulfuricurvum sp. TaxID=2025608 RepID=UPI00262EC1F7|nr:helix-turn-helix transcriptional regulator [Sulfuricurvum sp.]MDD4950514.1 helix-turn-helix transcriptional regulator [Sulfuricurvum sp.]